LYLLDSDAAKKLCQYELLLDLTIALGCAFSDFAVLPQLKFQLKLSNPPAALRKLGSEGAVALAQQLVVTAAEVVVVAEAANPLLSLNRPDIDSGEATLFAALYEQEEDSLISGDKRAFVALSEVDGVEAVDALWARLISFDEAMYLILQHASFENVSTKVRARPDADTAMSIIFGRVAASDHASVLAGLESYMRDLHANAQGKYILPF